MMRSKPNRKVMAILGLSLVLFAAPFIKPDAALAGGFSRTCSSINILGEEGSVYLVTACRKADGGWLHRQLKISDYIANYGGRLTWALGGGGFNRSCREVWLHPRSVLRAICADGRGGWSHTSINLDEKISNQNGVLAIDR